MDIAADIAYHWRQLFYESLTECPVAATQRIGPHAKERERDT